MLLKKRPLTKWSRVVRQINVPHKVYYSDKVSQRIVRTLVCVLMHLECRLDKARVEIVAWAAVSVARQQQFSYNSVQNFGGVNTIDVDSIHIRVNANSIRIQTGPFTLNPKSEFNAHRMRICRVHT